MHLEKLSTRTLLAVHRTVVDIFGSPGGIRWRDTFFLPWIDCTTNTRERSWSSLRPLVKDWLHSRALYEVSGEPTYVFITDTTYSLPSAVGLYAPKIITYFSDFPDTTSLCQKVNFDTMACMRMEIMFPWECGEFGLMITTNQYIRVYFPLFQGHAIESIEIPISRVSGRLRFRKAFMKPFESNDFLHSRTLEPWVLQ